MRTISILDTTICDYNFGNQIIMDSINSILNELFEPDFIFKLQYAEKFGKLSLEYMADSSFSFLCGTNALSSKMNKYKQIGFTIKDLFYVSNLVLLGVGWWQYQGKPNFYTRILLNKLLSKKTIHSVRDSYTMKMLKDIGIENVLNTSCPTTWNLTKEHCSVIPEFKSEKVITTLTDYNMSKEDDKNVLNLLLKNYKNVFFWIQGLGDLDYINKLELIDKKRLILINPKLNLFDKILLDNDLDYIGTRLHAGIRSIQFKKRALILSIDNRAQEMSKDIGLNTAERGDIEKIELFIHEKYETDLNVPFNNIQLWKSQFK